MDDQAPSPTPAAGSATPPEVPQFRWDNRRKMAYRALAWFAIMSLIVFGGIFTGYDGPLAETTELLMFMFGCVTIPVILYMGGTVAINWKHGR